MKKCLKIIFVLLCVVFLILTPWLFNGGAEYIVNYLEIHSIINQYFSTLMNEKLIDYSLTTASTDRKLPSTKDIIDFDISTIYIFRTNDELRAEATVYVLEKDGTDITTTQELLKTSNGWMLIRDY